MRSVDDTFPGSILRMQCWRKGVRIKTIRWVDNTPPKRIPPKNIGKKRPGVQLKLFTSVDPESGFATNFVWSDE